MHRPVAVRSPSDRSAISARRHKNVTAPPIGDAVTSYTLLPRTRISSNSNFLVHSNTRRGPFCYRSPAGRNAQGFRSNVSSEMSSSETVCDGSPSDVQHVMRYNAAFASAVNFSDWLSRLIRNARYPLVRPGGSPRATHSGLWLYTTPKLGGAYQVVPVVDGYCGNRCRFT